MQKCNRDETPHWPGSPCVSVSPETVTYLVPLGVLVLQDRVLGRLHPFLLLLFCCLPVSCRGLLGTCNLLALGQGSPQIVGQVPNYAKCLEL